MPDLERTLLAAHSFFGVGLLLGGLIGYLWARLRLDRRVVRLRRNLGALRAANDGLRAAFESLEQAAGTDRLTGAWNRRRFAEAAAAEMALARRRREPVSILMLDLDHFKRVNDSFGHETGDAVLAGAARAWKEALRASDPLVRWGGEEFLVLSPTNRLEGALVLAYKLQEAVRSLQFPGLGPITVSIGVAEYAPGEDLEAWVARADKALYRAKAEGRDRVVPAETPPEDTQKLRPILELQWEEDYASGHPVIDAQHRHLFQLANSLLAAFSDGSPREELTLRWHRLLAHAAQHFNDEEQILARAGYQGLAEHSDAHQRLLTRARELEADRQEGRFDLGRLANFLVSDLVRDHVIQEDMTFFKFLPKP